MGLNNQLGNKLDRLSSFLISGYSSMCRDVNKNGRIIIKMNPMMLSDHSVDSDSTNMAAIIKIEPGNMAINHDG